MKRILSSLLVAGLVAGFSSGAFAQATRTWVSGVGDDANPCSRTAPCKTFAGAISKTATNGEISVLDPGGFGVVTINKGITLNGTGTLAGILSAGSPSAVTVNDTTLTGTVILRDISMNGAGTGTSGVRYLAGKTVMIDHCWMYGMTSRGIDVNTGAGVTFANLKVINSVIENVGEDGVHMTAASGFLLAMISNSEIMNCGQDGIEAAANIRLGVSNSRVVRHSNGIITSSSTAQINLDDVFVSYADNAGLKASAGSSIRVSDSIIANNTTGLNPNGGTIDSFQGNSLIGNPTPGSFSSTTNKQ
jgi:hypothetical protein